MNFTDWYKEFYGNMKYNSDCYFSSEAAWIASKNRLKKEVLKIIYEKDYHYLERDDLANKIEKL
jgi:hypothetical protein